jgi:uncharacterized protein (DUF486 family)
MIKTENSKSGAYPTLKKIVSTYSYLLPSSSYPFVMLTISSCCVFFSWFGGNYLFHSVPLLERMFYQWLITAVEYLFLLPGIAGSVEILGYSQNSLAVFVHALQLIAYFILNNFTTKIVFTWRHYTSFFLIIIAIVLVI